MVRPHAFGSRQRSHRVGDAKHPGTATAGERNAIDSPVEELPAGSHGSVITPARRSRASTTRAATTALGSPSATPELSRPWSRHDENEIEPIEESPRELRVVARDSLRRTHAFRTRVAAGAAGTEVHRRNQREPSREHRAAGDPGDADDPILERLTEGLENRAVKLGELVEKQNAAVGEARLAGTRAGASSDDRGRRRAVVRSTERWVRDERPSRRKQSRHRVDPCHLERLVDRESRKDPGKTAGEHRLACPRRTGEQEIVPPGRRDLECAPCAFLSANVCEVRAGRGGLGSWLRRLPWLELASEVGAGLGEMAEWYRLDPRERHLRSGLGRTEKPPIPARRAASAQASAPGTGLSRPSSASSPTAAWPERRFAGICRDAASSARAIGRSKPDPSLRRSAGARLTVIRRRGHSSSALVMPLRTRSFASWQALSGRPTIENPGTPRCRWASTSTSRASRPTRACVSARANMS